MKQWKYESPVGPIYLVASAKGLQSIYFQQKSQAPFADSLEGAAPELAILAEAVRQLGEYFAGERKVFELPMDASGTEFQKRVWAQLCRIPYGETKSYSELAKSLQNDKATRAVGTANGRNPLSIIVPCHRVIASDGGLGGYSGGLENKAKLLELEKRHAR